MDGSVIIGYPGLRRFSPPWIDFEAGSYRSYFKPRKRYIGCLMELTFRRQLPRIPFVTLIPRIRIASVANWLDTKFSMHTCKGLMK